MANFLHRFHAINSNFHKLLVKKFIIFIFAFAIVLSVVYFKRGLQQQPNRFKHSLSFYADSTATSVPSPSSVQGQELVINTSNCKIPQFQAWSSQAQTLLPKKCMKYFLEDPKCPKNHIHAWSYLQDSYLHINLTALLETGYSWNSIRCCYRTIHREVQVLGRYDMNADQKVRYSDKCYPVTHIKQFMNANFIRLHCISTSLPTFGDVVSREFFANVRPDAKARSKMKKWVAIKSKEDRPPSIIILGVDTVSRLNSLRNFKKSLSVLRSIGAIEMKGYTKVGETTFQNSITFLSGYTVEDLQDVCFRSYYEPFDNCPLIWKYFSKLGYLTSTLEDAPFVSPFNFMKKGFIQKPVDFYLRPFMLAIMKHLPRPVNKYLRCIGSKQVEEVFLNYIEDMLEKASPSRTPLFVHMWLASAHECSLSPKYTDWIFAETIRKISGTYQNVILIFMSDHGEGFGPFRESLQGWYEDKLPMFWIYLPAKLKYKFPEWLESLQVNSNRLTSHFDLYKTFVHVLKTFDKNNLANEIYDKQLKQRGQSLFTQVPENRTCKEAGIWEGYCPCTAPVEIDMKSESVTMAVTEAINYITKMIPEVCVKPVLQKVVRAQEIDNTEGYTIFIVTFRTDPGNFLFEATVKDLMYQGKGFQVTNEVLRLNAIVRNVNCIKTNAYLERYCYCK